MIEKFVKAAPRESKSSERKAHAGSSLRYGINFP
jgi:hypothetical protein